MAGSLAEQLVVQRGFVDLAAGQTETWVTFPVPFLFGSEPAVLWMLKDGPTAPHPTLRNPQCAQTSNVEQITYEKFKFVTRPYEWRRGTQWYWVAIGKV